MGGPDNIGGVHSVHYFCTSFEGNGQTTICSFHKIDGEEGREEIEWERGSVERDTEVT